MEAGLGGQKSPVKKRKRTPSEKAAALALAFGAGGAAGAPLAPPAPVDAFQAAMLRAASGAMPHHAVAAPASAHARRPTPQSGAAPGSHAGGGGGSAQRTPHSTGARSAAGAGDSKDTPLRLDFDVDDPLEFFLSQRVPEALARAALAACNNNPDLAQVWIMTHGSSPAPRHSSGGHRAGHTGAAAAAAALRAAGVPPGGSSGDDEEDEEAAEAAFQRDLEKAQLASEAQSKEEERAREAAFVASARAAPIETFEETSYFLAVVRGVGGPTGAAGAAGGGATLSDDELRALLEPLAEILLLERTALKSYAQQVVPYFRRQAAALAAMPGGTAARAKMLAERVSELMDPARPGSMNGMPPKGRSGGLPAVFDGDEDGALCVSDSDVLVVD